MLLFCPPVLARTTAKVAASPSATGTFLPLSRPPPKVVAMLRGYFGLSFEDWGKDVCGGNYPWAKRTQPP